MEKMPDFWCDRMVQHINMIKSLSENESILRVLNNISEVIISSYISGGKLLICGNGGSAADSQHIATELVSRFLKERKALDAEALTVNTSSITAIGNDYCFEKVFSRQVEAKGKAGDILLGISTSGNAKNIIEAIRVAKSMDIITIGLTGNNKDSLICKLSDYCICVPSDLTPRIQEAHILIGHMLCEFIENKLFN